MKKASLISILLVLLVPSAGWPGQYIYWFTVPVCRTFCTYMNLTCQKICLDNPELCHWCDRNLTIRSKNGNLNFFIKVRNSSLPHRATNCPPYSSENPEIVNQEAPEQTYNLDDIESVNPGSFVELIITTQERSDSIDPLIEIVPVNGGHGIILSPIRIR